MHKLVSINYYGKLIIDSTRKNSHKRRCADCGVILIGKGSIHNHRKHTGHNVPLKCICCHHKRSN